MRYPPPKELETNPLKPGETVELWNGETFDLELHFNPDFPIKGVGCNTGWAWASDGHHRILRDNDERNVRRVLSREQPEPDPDAWKKTPEAASYFSSCFDAFMVNGVNPSENNADLIKFVGIVCNAKLEEMHEWGLL